MNAADPMTVMKALAALIAPMVAEHLKDGDPNELLSVRQVSKALHIRQEAAKRLILSGEIARPKGMRRLRVSRRELERYTAGASK
jgi:hypothetical protein